MATTGMRPLHWVIKSGDLASTVDFYSKVCQLKVLRHEEFQEGCEATCNGRYGGAWSKTILGKNSERTDFCLEIVFNWGITRYNRGNAFRRLKVRDDAAGTRRKAAETWWSTARPDKTPDTPEAGAVPDPDGNLLEFVATETTDGEDFICLSLSVKDLRASLDFYQRAFLANLIPRSELHGSVPSGNSQLIRYGAKGTTIELVEGPQTEEVDQGDAQGRFATETPDGEPDALAKRVGHDYVLHGPLELPPHNERVVVVTDPDGNQFAFVEARGYERCIVAGAREIDWKYREEFAKTSRKRVKAPPAAVAES